MSVDKRFALIDTDGIRRYPYMSQASSGSYGFVLGRSAKARHTTSIEEVIQEVVLHGASMRVKALEGPHANQGNSLNLHARKGIVGFYVAPELVHLVEAARPVISDGKVSALKPTTPNAVPPSLDCVRVSDVVAALDELRALITAPIRSMLEIHASAPGLRTTLPALVREASELADMAPEELEARYRAFCRALGEKLGLAATSGLEPLAFGAVGDKNTPWVLRPQVLAALKETGTIEPDDEPSPGTDFSADPQYRAASPTTRRALVNARVGQGGYRTRMLRLWNHRCAVTGCRVEAALVASHAKAWADSTNAERLDEYNGLLLSATLDKLFDAGLISFDDAGRLLSARTLLDSDLAALGIQKNSRLRDVAARHVPYLQAHRAKHGWK